MTDLSKYPCPWCDNTNGNAADGGYASCSECGRGVIGDDPTDEAAAAAWIKLSEKVHGNKQHDGKTVDVRIAVAVDEGGKWGASGWYRAKDEYAVDDAVVALHGVERAVTWITATLPLPVVQEVKGSVEG